MTPVKFIFCSISYHTGMRYHRLAALFTFFIIAALLLPSAIALAGGTTTITASGDTQPFGDVGGSDVWWGQSFTVASGTVTEMTFTFGANSGSPTGTATWAIYSDTSGHPGTLLDSGTFTPVPSSTNTLSVTGSTLTNSTYWLVLHSTSSQSSNNQWRWQSSTTSTYAGGMASISYDGGGSWTAQPTVDLQCSITTSDLPITSTPTWTPTFTYTPTSTFTPTPTYTETPTWTPTFTWTPTETWTASPGPSPTDIWTPTFTWTPTDTLTPTPTFTPTFTFTPTETFTPTFTWTPTETLTPSSTPETTPTLPGGSSAFMRVATLQSGQPVALEYTVSAGEAINALVSMVGVGLLSFVTLVLMVKRR